MDVPDYPNPYSIRGAYTMEGGQIVLRTKLFQPGKEPIDLEELRSDDPEWIAKKIIRTVGRLIK